MSRLDNTSASYGMEIGAEKTKLMNNNTNGINEKITMNGQKCETVSKFKYLGSVITDEGSKPEIISRIAQVTAALTRLKPIWKNKNITLPSKIRLMRSLVVSMDSYSRTTKKSTNHENEVLSKDHLHLTQGPCNQQRGPQHIQTSHRAIWTSPNDGKETEAEMVWARLTNIRHDKDHPARQ